MSIFELVFPKMKQHFGVSAEYSVSVDLDSMKPDVVFSAGKATIKDLGVSLSFQANTGNDSVSFAVVSMKVATSIIAEMKDYKITIAIDDSYIEEGTLSLSSIFDVGRSQASLEKLMNSMLKLG